MAVCARLARRAAMDADWAAARLLSLSAGSITHFTRSRSAECIDARAARLHQFLDHALYLHHHRRGGDELAHGLQRRQRLQSARALHMAGAQRSHRAAAAPDPALDARPRWYRCVSRRSDPGLRLRAVRRDPQLCQALRVTPPLTQPWRVDPEGLRVLVRASPKSSREGIAGVVATVQGPALWV